MARKNGQWRCMCGAIISASSARCVKCAADLRHQNPPAPRSWEDNGLKAAFRAVFGFDPFNDPNPAWKFPRRVKAQGGPDADQA